MPNIKKENQVTYALLAYGEETRNGNTIPIPTLVLGELWHKEPTPKLKDAKLSGVTNWA
jgi:hypothetical protein